jgi:hypothetical protein
VLEVLEILLPPLASSASTNTSFGGIQSPMNGLEALENRFAALTVEEPEEVQGPEFPPNLGKVRVQSTDLLSGYLANQLLVFPVWRVFRDREIVLGAL